MRGRNLAARFKGFNTQITSARFTLSCHGEVRGEELPRAAWAAEC
jgi:hypothetical protein